MKVFPTVPTPSEKLLSLMVRVLFYSLKTIGLAPLSMEIKTRARKSIFLFSKMGLLYNLALGILIQVTGVLNLSSMLSTEYPVKSVITQALDGMQYMLLIFACSFIVIYWAFRQKKAAIIMNRLLDVHFLLSGANQQSSNKRTYIFLSVQMAYHVSLWTMSLSTIYVFHSISSMVMNFFMEMIMYWFRIEYSIILGCLAREFEILHQNLSNLKESPNYLFRTSLTTDHPAILCSSTHSQLATIKLLQSVRTTLCELSRDIADFFSLPILLSITCAFLTLISAVYFLLNMAFILPVDVPISSDVINLAAWFLLTISPLILLSFNVTETAKKAKLTGRIVHKLIATAKKERIIVELEQFSLQLLHEDVSFTAYGFFNLDFTLIHSILGATATYLIIIIQFVRSNSHKD